MDDWAKLMEQAGARYCVLVTKHHDGYTLWPTDTPNPRIPGYYSKRDFVGELTEAVRARGMKMGLYYSGVDRSACSRPTVPSTARADS